jgi:hypothetical protein
VDSLDDPFKPGSFYDNFDKAVGALGAGQIPLAFDLAQVNYDNNDDRDRLFRILRMIGDES